MNRLFLLLLLSTLVVADLPWDSLRATWLKFTSLPITESDAQYYGWNQIIKCGDSRFQGNVYQLNGDVGVQLLFDSAGNLAGLQSGSMDAPTVPNQKFYQVINNGTTKYWVITAYFEDPSNICSQKGSRKTNAIGDRVWVQYNDNDYLQLPLSESNATSAGWVKGKCFVSMGEHYWYNISNDLDCNYMNPIFLLYNGGVLDAFGFNFMGPYQNSPRYEHPSADNVKLFFQPETLPSCLIDGRPISTLHIYFTNPIFDFC